MCDTVRVDVIPELTISNAVDTFFFCTSDVDKTIELIIDPPGSYAYVWNNGAVTTDNTLQINSEGIYNVVAYNPTWPSCSRDSISFVVAFDEPVADIIYPALGCSGEPVEYTAAYAGDDDAIYNWGFGVNATPATASGRGPHEVTYSDCSEKEVTLSVFVDGCYSYDTLIVERPDTIPPVLTNVPDDVSIECQDCIQSFLNGEMEFVADFNGQWTYMSDDLIEGWQTTATDGIIEIWRDGMSGVSAYAGEIFAELNGTQASDFYQEFCTVPTTTLQISFAHHKRVASNNTTDDILGVYIGPDLNSLTRVGSAVATNTSGWTVHTVSYEVPAGQLSTVFLFRADQGAPGNLTFGNLIDAVTVVTLFDVVVVPNASDNCDSNVELELDETRIDGGCGENYRLVRSWTAIDDCGNTTRDSQVLVDPPADVTVECSNIPNTAVTTITDNCGAAIDTSVVVSTGTVGCGYTITRSWTATDSCGNVSTHNQTLTVEDRTPPEFPGFPADQTVECNNIPAIPTITPVDACNTVVTSSMVEMIDSLNGCWLTVRRVWSAEDDCGNDTTLTQVITVEDNDGPVIQSVPANVTISCGDPIPTAPSLIATDNCDSSVDVTMTETSCEDYYPNYTEDNNGVATFLDEAENPNVTSYPATVDNLTLTAVCSPDPNAVKRWQVNNPNSIDVYISWELIGTTQSGGFWVPPGDAYFFTNTESGTNTVRINWI